MMQNTASLQEEEFYYDRTRVFVYSFLEVLAMLIVAAPLTWLSVDILISGLSLETILGSVLIFLGALFCLSYIVVIIKKARKMTANPLALKISSDGIWFQKLLSPIPWVDVSSANITIGGRWSFGPSLKVSTVDNKSYYVRSIFLQDPRHLADVIGIINGKPMIHTRARSGVAIFFALLFVFVGIWVSISSILQYVR